MEGLPLVTIITGYYNRKENLKESVQSVLDQSYPNFEYLIFDDCSTDGTSEMLASFSDPRLRIIRHEKNIGFTKGIIAAIAEAKGEYIAIHGAGDVSFRDRIQKQAQYLNKNPDVAIVGCLLEDVHNNNTIVHSPVSEASTHRYTQGEVMYRKSLYYQTGGYNPIFKYGQFTNLKYELLKLGKPGLINEVLYRRIHFQNGVTKNPKKKIEQRVYIKIGQELADKNTILDVDISHIVISTCLSNMELVKNTPQEGLFIRHLKNKSRFAVFLYKLYAKGLISFGLLKNYIKRVV